MVFADVSCLQWREGTWTVVKARARTLLRYLFWHSASAKTFLRFSRTLHQATEVLKADQAPP